jgi:AAA domain
VKYSFLFSRSTQKALLQSRLPYLAGAVDTVERFQGGERDLIIVSATVSDVAYAQSESDFLLEPRRLTVAVSRPKRKLIVLASQAIFTLMPADLDDYERGALWKHLRHACVSPALWTGEYGGYRLRVFTVNAMETHPCCQESVSRIPTPHFSDATLLLSRVSRRLDRDGQTREVDAAGQKVCQTSRPGFLCSTLVRAQTVHCIPRCVRLATRRAVCRHWYLYGTGVMSGALR